MSFVLATVGYKALVLLYVWLLSAIAASELSKRKGYGEKPGLGSGLLLTVVGPIIWLFIPAKADSPWATRRGRLSGPPPQTADQEKQIGRGGQGGGRRGRARGRSGRQDEDPGEALRQDDRPRAAEG
jgi:hypothetical protein